MTASRHHGITANEFTHGVRAISDISTAIIGMVCTADDADNAVFPLNTPIFHTSAYNVLGKAGEKGTLAKSLDAIVDQADAQIVIVRVPESDNADTLKANVIGSATGGNYTGLKALRRAKAITGQTPKILGVPEMDSQDVVTELVGLGGKPPISLTASATAHAVHPARSAISSAAASPRATPSAATPAQAPSTKSPAWCIAVRWYFPKPTCAALAVGAL